MIICYGDEWWDSKSLNLKQPAVSPQTLCHKRAKYCATDKINGRYYSDLILIAVAFTILNNGLRNQRHMYKKCVVTSTSV